MAFIPYIFFDGDCAKAFDFYAKATGGKIGGRLTYEDSPMACGPMSGKWKKRLAHICLNVGGSMLMGADVPPGEDCGMAQAFSINITMPTTAAAQRAFKALMKGGKIYMPMDETFFAKAFGMGVDKFGMPWMVMCPKAPPKQTKKAKRK